MEHFSITSRDYLYARVRKVAIIYTRAYIYREGATKVVINRAILAKNNVLAWKFREWNFCENSLSKERDLWIYHETFKFLKMGGMRSKFRK